MWFQGQVPPEVSNPEVCLGGGGGGAGVKPPISQSMHLFLFLITGSSIERNEVRSKSYLCS